MSKHLKSYLQTLDQFIREYKPPTSAAAICGNLITALAGVSKNPDLGRQYQYSLATDCLPDCLDCGACCRRKDMQVDTAGCTLSEPELKAMSSQPCNSKTATRFMLKSPNGDCIAFDAESGGCKIYGRRPQICGDFSRGSVQCLESILKKR